MPRRVIGAGVCGASPGLHPHCPRPPPAPAAGLGQAGGGCMTFHGLLLRRATSGVAQSDGSFFISSGGQRSEIKGSAVPCSLKPLGETLSAASSTFLVVAGFVSVPCLFTSSL